MNARLPAPPPRHTDWAAWRQHFADRAHRPLPAVDGDLPLAEADRAALADSLAVFQLGESGEGRIAHQIDRAQLAGIDGDYRAALKLFVAEEGRHARILGQMVRAAGGRLLSQSWTEGLFRHGRRLMGVRLKLLVLLAAEVIAVVFYGAIARATAGSSLGAALVQIIEDEDHHLAFHLDFFRTQTRSLPRQALFLAAWWAVGAAACLVVAWDHRRCLKALGVAPKRLLQDCVAQLSRVSRGITDRPAAAQSALPLTASKWMTVSP